MRGVAEISSAVRCSLLDGNQRSCRIRAMTRLPALASVSVLTLALAGCGSVHHHREQGPQWHPPVDMLLKYDTNHDGSVTRAEMEAGLRADFAKADYKHLGCLDKDEVRAVNEQRWEEDKSTTSPLVDFEQRGCIDFNEFAATARSLFDQLDTNGDGVLTPAELHPNRDSSESPPPARPPHPHP
jgi:EF hand